MGGVGVVMGGMSVGEGPRTLACTGRMVSEGVFSVDPYTVRPVHISGVRTRAQGEELSVFNTVTADFFVLNRTGRFVWDSCDGRTTLAEIAERLHQACVTPPGLNAVLDDVCGLAETMRDRGLIELKL